MVNYDYLYDKDYYDPAVLHTKSHIQKKTLGYTEIEHGTILPWRMMGAKYGGGIVDETGTYIEDSALHIGIGVGYQIEADTRIYSSDETVVYLGMFPGIWGHWLTDNISRFWFLQSDAYKELFRNCPLVYVPFPDAMSAEQVHRMLAMLGVDYKKLIPITEVTRCRKIIFPDRCFFREHENVLYFTDEYRCMIDRIRDFSFHHLIPTNCPKIYFTYPIRQIGESYLQHYFQSKGYRVVAPEKLTLEEQLNLLMNCEAFASTEGSCSHNVVFLKEKADVILIPRANYMTGYQQALNQLYDTNVTYIDSTLSLFVSSQPWIGPFFYFLSDQLLAHFGDKIALASYRQFMNSFQQYACQCIESHFGGDNPGGYQYYRNVAAEFFQRAKAASFVAASNGQ